MVRGSAEKVASLFPEVSVYKETEDSKKYGDIDGSSESRIPLQLFFVLHIGPV